jgi:hypothetical protein
MVAGAHGNISFSKSALHEIYKFSKGIPRLVNLLCDRALLGGFVEQTYHIDRRIIKKAKDSLLGEERSPKPFYSWFLPRKLVPLRITLWTILLLFLVGLILMNQSYFSSFTRVKDSIWGKIEYGFFRIPGTTPPYASAIPLDKEWVQDSQKMEPAKDSEVESQEVSK